MSDSQAVRWGFCCAGKIANDFSIAMDKVTSESEGTHRKVAVAARDKTKAEEFAKRHGFERAYGSYAELAQDAEVEIVYVSSLHPQHFELCKLYLEANKNVLCEKPLTMKLSHTEELVRLAREKGLFFMEGFWSRFFPVYQSVKKHVSNGDIGTVNQVHAHFHVPTPTERMVKEHLGGSAWFDIGVYCLNLVDFLYEEFPNEIQSVSSRLSETVDKDLAVILKYEGGRSASLSTSITCHRPNSAVICGTQGYIEISPPFFHCATEYLLFKKGDTQPTLHSFPLSEDRISEYIYPAGEGFKYEIEHVRHCLKEKKVKESPVIDLEATLRLARVTDEIVKQVTAKPFTKD